MKINDEYPINDPNRYIPDFDNVSITGSDNGCKQGVNRICDVIYSISNKVNSLDDLIADEISNAELRGRKDGFKIGFIKGFDVGNSNIKIKNIDYDSIKKFSEWCYINGIDFSYMMKSTDDTKFTTRVINKFKKDIENDE